MFWSKKTEILQFKCFLLRMTILTPMSFILFSTKVWKSKSGNLVSYDHPIKMDAFCATKWLTSTLKFFLLIFSFNLKSWYAVEISDQKILNFGKSKFLSFTGKKNQVFWTRIDNFRNFFRTLAYPDVTWSVSLRL